MQTRKKDTKPQPVDMDLYATVKSEVYEQIPQHSAYRSGILVQEYKKAFAKKYGSKKSPYSGKRIKTRGLKRWFDEKWVNQRGKIGYSKRGDVYRPTVRITSKTPKTFNELSNAQIARARKSKRQGRRASFTTTH